MLEAICLCLLVFTVQGHTNKLQEDADFQTALMPQELNPDFVSEKDHPWKAVMPILRTRRDVSTDLATPVSITSTVKRYSRIIACVVLALSAIVEIVLYVMDSYMT
ncbi:hypothetical protein evm_005427 [Chilo suppressalis]|nr:hypothetical protein evm_005427 [Chilo suppressalis]